MTSARDSRGTTPGSGRVAWGGLAVVSGLLACSPAGALVQVEDPEAVATQANRLEVWTSARSTPEGFEVPEDGFPLTFVLTGEVGDAGTVFVSALDGTRRVGVGATDVWLSRSSPGLVIALEPACARDAECSDQLFCNGEERCELGFCVQGGLPCGPALEGCVSWACAEEAQVCLPEVEPALDDGEVCTEDLCFDGRIEHRARPDGSPCPGGACEAGRCVP